MRDEGEGTMLNRDKQEKGEMALTGFLQQLGKKKPSDCCPRTEDYKKHLRIKKTN